MNFAKMSSEAERALEWINLALGTLCVCVTVFMWITSPRPARGDSLIVGSFPLLMFFSLPLLLVTSAMLLFTNRQRATIGFGALFLSAIALSQSRVVFD